MTEEEHAAALDRLKTIDVTARGGAVVMAVGTTLWGLAMLAPPRTVDSHVPGQAIGLLSEVPGWPRVVALVAIAVGLLLASGLVSGRRRCALIGAAAQTALWSSYAGIFLVGTIVGGGIWGPCVVYAVLAACSSVVLWLVQEEGP